MSRTLFFLTAFMGTILICLSSAVINVSADYKADYYDFDEMIALLEDLETQSASKTPDVYSLQIIGYSLQNNPIYAVKFSDDPGTEDDSEPDVLIDSGIHSNEWLPVESTLHYIEYLFDAYYDTLHPDHTDVVDLVENFEIWIIPMINPDGRIRDDLNGGDPENFWRDTIYHDDDTVGWRMNVQEVDCPPKPGGTTQGIDLNRNFSYKFWDQSDCESTIYSGGTGFVAPEARVVKQFVHNHMISLILHQHSSIQFIFSSSDYTGLGNYLSNEAAGIYNNDPTLPNPCMVLGSPNPPSSPDALLSHVGSTHPLYQQTMGNTGSFLGTGVCNGSRFTGQYFNWAWVEIGDPVDCPLAPDNHSRRAIQMIMYEYPFDDDFALCYGHVSEGKIGQYQLGDNTNGFHPSSGEANQWVIEKSKEINKYFIQQSRYPFSPRNYTDMSRKDVAPETDLAIVGAKISEVGIGLPGCFNFDDYGRDTLEPGEKRVTWNVQNNGTANRTIESEITICNLTDDPDCLSPTSTILTRVDVTPETIETFTYDHVFPDPGECKMYSVTLTTGETNEYDNDYKRFVFVVTSATDTDCDGTWDGDDNCSATENGPTGGTCESGEIGKLCLSDEWCTPEYTGTCDLDQGDNYPPDSNDCGNVCECEGNFDDDQDQDVSDAATFKLDFGRSPFFTPCTNEEVCNGDFDCDVDVDGTDAAKFKEDFGRSTFFNSCPICPTDPWCEYVP